MILSTAMPDLQECILFEDNNKGDAETKCLDTSKHPRCLNYHFYSVREQMNFGTAYLDGSGIYGATPESADKLREFDGGFLKVSE